MPNMQRRLETATLETLVKSRLESRGYTILKLEGKPNTYLAVKPGEAVFIRCRVGSAKSVPADLTALADRSGLKAKLVNRPRGCINIIQEVVYDPTTGSEAASVDTIP
ncbi:MAG: hypothetical protein QW282_06065 [Nitrososphaerales archaeon]